MRIGIDARLYGIKDRGIGRYTEKLIEYLEKLDQQNEYFIFLRQDGFNSYQPQNKNFHKVLADFRPYSLKEQIIFPCLLKKYKLDLVHFTHFNVPIFYRRTFIVTIHDLIISKFPASRRRASTLPPILYYLKLFFYNLVLRNAIKSAKKIIAVSEATKKDIVEILGVNANKISVIYEGIDLLKIENCKLSARGGSPPDGRAGALGGKIDVPYILYVGAAYPHKNLERLLLAFKSLITHKPITLNLILVGRKDFFYQRLEKYSQELGLSDKVIFKGEVSDEELATLYKNALFFIFPSFCEGFGLPGLEAMAYGLPVAAASVSSLPEILGKAAYYFNPHNVKEIAKTIEVVATDEKLRNNLKEKGFEQIKKYSWMKMAEKILEIYKNIH